MNHSFSKRALPTAIALFLVCFSLHATEIKREQSTEFQSDTSGVEFSTRVSTGYLSGEAREYSFQPSNANHAGHKNSELIWDIDGMLMLGGGLSISPKHGLSFHGDFWLSVGNGDGSMNDYDWYTSSPEWTHWSHHENTDVTGVTLFDINAELQFYSIDTLSLSGIAGFKREQYEWQVYGGNAIYSGEGFRDIRFTMPDSELEVNYEQTYYAPYIGLGLSSGKGKIVFSSRLIYSPYASGEFIDHHHVRNLTFGGTYDGGRMVGVDIAGAYVFTDKLALEVGYQYQNFSMERFDMVWTEQQYSQTLSDAAGMENETSMLFLSLGYAL